MAFLAMFPDAGQWLAHFLLLVESMRLVLRAVTLLAELSDTECSGDGSNNSNSNLG